MKREEVGRLATGSPAAVLREALRLVNTAKSGLHYCTDPYDVERFRTVLDAATRIVAMLGDVEPHELSVLLSVDEGPVTPKIAVRAGVFDEQMRVLLVRETADGAWSLPGGWCDSGMTPMEAIEAELIEEAGVSAAGLEYCGYFDQRVLVENPVFHILCHYFVGTLASVSATISAEHEIDEVDFFGADDLPPLSRGRVRSNEITRLFAWRRGDRRLMWE